MLYELGMVIGTILFLAILWTMFMYPLGLITDIFKNMTARNNATFMNETINITVVGGQMDLAYSTMYISLFFIIIVLLIFIVKVAQQQQALGRGYF